MELRHIRYFLVLAEELNFSRAAEKLHIAQPPLSRQIQELEEEIGAKLFHRTRRKVELTNAGKVFQNKAYQILEQVEQARISTRLSSTGRQGEFRIGFTGAVQDLIPTMQEYRKRYPQVGILLKHMSTAEQVDALNENRIDIGLVSQPVNSNKIQVVPIKKMDFVAAFPEQHPLAAKHPLYLHDLANETFIMTTKSVGALYHDTFMNVFEKAGFTPKITIQADNLHTVLALVTAGMGVTLTPSPFQEVSGMIRRKLEDVHQTIIGSLAWRKDNQSEILNEFLAFFFRYYSKELEMMDIDNN